MALGNAFVPLRLPLVEEGMFQLAIDEAMADVQQGLAAYVEAWKDGAKGAKACVKFELVFKVDNPRDGHFSVESKVTTTMPKRPSRVTAAIACPNTRADGTKVLDLFVRDSGSTPGDPTQYHLPTPEFSEETE